MSEDTMPLATSAYIADTQHLSNSQHGAYLLILMSMWRGKGWLPDDDKILANIAKLTLDKWRKIAPGVRSLLIAEAGRLSQKRLLAELEKSARQSQKNRISGSAGGKAKALKTNDLELATAINTPASRQGFAVAEPRSPDSTLPFLSESLSTDQLLETGSKKGRAKSKTGTALPDEWAPSEADVAYGKNLGLTRKQVEDCAIDMRLWAKANAHRQVARKAGETGWRSAFQGWLRREAPKLKGRGGQPKVSFYDISEGNFRGEDR